ncbi:MAG: hypothetical protein K2Q18_18440, partial [Bdellovibrionales bacterium]|nr:hypothetical protein [Bdellovibrionales bacterium]
PACWSTNYSDVDGVPDFGCYGAALGEIAHISEWIQESQLLTGDNALWNELMNEIDNSIK